MKIIGPRRGLELLKSIIKGRRIASAVSAHLEPGEQPGEGLLPGPELVFSRLGLEKILQATFDEECYYQLHEDVRAAGIKAHIHFLNHGIKDGRSLLDEGIAHAITVDEWIDGMRSPMKQDHE